jgi:serine/threonine protein kinase
MSLAAGTRVGAYEILAPLGAGGMGEVYRARDTRLGREVAIKFLGPRFATKPEASQRLLEEARAASALNHANIVALFDICSENGNEFLVMELVRGKTLDHLIGNRGLAVATALKYAIPIADALARAHAAGILHRDLKPSNIMITQDGVPKILDFGLAQLWQPQTASDEDATELLTEQSLNQHHEGIAGTAAYMSPEQAEGKKLDPRSDIFSFGAVLYEMITGRRAFHGESTASTLAAVLRHEPEAPTKIVPRVPRELERIIQRCLRKDPNRRFQSMSDVRVELEEVREESESRTPLPLIPARRRNLRLWTFGGAGAFVVLMAAAVWYVNIRPPEGELTPIPLTTYRGFEGNASFSPDGSQVAFSWCKDEGTPTWHPQYSNTCDIYVKQIGVEPPARLTETRGKDFSPAWSPDGKWIAFVRLVSSTKLALLLIPQRGGQERVVLEQDLTGFPDMPFGSHLAWTPDSKWLACATPGREGWFLSLVAVDSAEKRRLTRFSGAAFGDISPSISPNGRMLAFSRWQEKCDLYSMRLSNQYSPAGEPVRLQSEETPNLGAAWLPDGSGIVFASKWNGENGLWRTSASSSSRPRRLAFATTFASEPAVSRRGNRLAYTVFRNDSNIWRVELVGQGHRPSVPVSVISSTRVEGGPACSPDGKKLAFVSDQSGVPEVWLSDLDGSNPHQLTSFGRTFLDLPQWSPDGQNIAVTILEPGKDSLGVVNANTGALRRLPGDGKWPSWSPDGQWLYFATNHPEGIGKVRPNGEARIQITSGLTYDMPQPSPDGKFIYFQIGWPLQLSIWRMPVDGGEKTKIIDGVSTGGLWTVGPDGIYFFTTPDAKGRSEIGLYMFATERVKRIMTVEHSVGPKIAASPDGGSIFYPQYDQQGSDLMLVENFH